MRGSKAQMPGQILVFILAIIVFSLIIIYGYNAVSDFRQKKDNVLYIGFERDFKAAVSSISSDYGTVRKEKYPLPSEFKEVCFVDKEGSFSGSSAIIQDAAGLTPDNVFLVKEVGVKSFEAGPLVPDAGVDCISVNDGVVRIGIEGLGDSARIFSW